MHIKHTMVSALILRHSRPELFTCTHKHGRLTSHARSFRHPAVHDVSPFNLSQLKCPSNFHLHRSALPCGSRYVKESLQLHDQMPLVLCDFISIELLEGIDAGAADHGIEGIFFIQLAAVERLVGAFNLDRNGRLALFADSEGLVVALY